MTDTEHLDLHNTLNSVSLDTLLVGLQQIEHL